MKLVYVLTVLSVGTRSVQYPITLSMYTCMKLVGPMSRTNNAKCIEILLFSF